MSISMWNIYDALPYNKKEPIILDGRDTVRYARLYIQDDLRSNTVYVAEGSEFYHGGEHDVLLIHGNDTIVIDNATVSEVFNATATIVDRYFSFEQRLRDFQLKEDGVQRMLELAITFMRGSYYAYATSGMPLALAVRPEYDPENIWKEISETGPFTHERLGLLNRYIDFTGFLPGVEMTTKDAKEGAFSYTFLGIGTHARPLGFLIFSSYEKPLPFGMRTILQKLAAAITGYFNHHPEKINLVEHAADMFSQLLDSADPSQEVLRFFREIQWKAIDSYQIIAIDCGAKDKNPRITGLVREIRSIFLMPMLCFRENRLILMVNLRIEKNFNAAIKRFRVRIRGDFTCGISRWFPYLLQAVIYCEQAIHEQARAVAEEKNISFAQDNDMTYFRGQLADSVISECYINRELLRLVSHDLKEGTEYFETMRAYLLSGQHASDAARMLNVHRNTFLYRMEQIRESIDLTEFEEALASYDVNKLESFFISCALIDNLLAERKKRLRPVATGKSTLPPAAPKNALSNPLRKRPRET